MHRAAAHESETPLFILYTSGSTGKPKGVLHTTAGYLLGVTMTTKYVFDLKDTDVYWCTADIGWVTGHSYVVYGPLSAGATVFMYEGAPNHPGPDRFWDIIDRHGVTVFYTAPTAIRAFMRWGDEHVLRHHLRSLRLLGTVGEPINPEAWMWYHRTIGKKRCPIVDTWWQTETGAIMVTPLPGVTPTKPGSATLPFFGVVPKVVNGNGDEAPRNSGGKFVITRPVALDAAHALGRRRALPAPVLERGARACISPATARGRTRTAISGSSAGSTTCSTSPATASARPRWRARWCRTMRSPRPPSWAGPTNSRARPSWRSSPSKPACSRPTSSRRSLRNHVAKEIGSLAKPDTIRFAAGLPKTRSGKIMRRILKEIAAGGDVKGDTTTLEDFSVVATLQQEE